MAKTYQRNANGRMALIWYQRPLLWQGVAGIVLLASSVIRWLYVKLVGIGLTVGWLDTFSFWFLVLSILVFVGLLAFKVWYFVKEVKAAGKYSEYRTQKQAIKAIERGLLSAGLVRKTVSETVVDVPTCEFVADKTHTIIKVEKLPSVADLEKVAEAINSSLRKGKFANYAVSEPLQTADGLYYLFELNDVNTNLSFIPKRIEDLVPDDPYSFKLLAGSSPVFWDYPNQPHALLSGLTGSFKTTTAYLILAEALGAGCDVYILDYKREMLGFKQILGDENVVSEPSEILSLLSRLVDDMTLRNERIGAEIERRGVVGLNGKDLNARPVFIFCEELGALGEALGKEKSTLHGYLKTISMVGRSSLYMLVNILQVADVNSAPAGMRSNANLKILLGKSTSEMITQMFSSGYVDVVTKNPGKFKGWYFLNGYSTQPSLFYVPNLHENGLNTIETFKELYEVGRKRVYNEMI